MIKNKAYHKNSESLWYTITANAFQSRLGMHSVFRNYDSMALMLFPSALWNLYGMELRRLKHVDDFYRQGDNILPDEDADEDFRRIARLCEEIKLENIYKRMGKKAFRTQKKFLENADDKISKSASNVCSKYITEAVSLAAKLGIKRHKRSS